MKQLGLLLFIFSLNIQLFGQVNYEKKYSADRPAVRSLAFSPEGKYIVASANSRLNIFFTGGTNEKASSFKTNLKSINSIQFVTKEIVCITGEKYFNLNTQNSIEYLNIKTGATVKTKSIDKNYNQISKIIALKDTSSIAFIDNGSLYFSNETNIKPLDNVNEYADITYSARTNSLYAITKSGKIIQFNMINFKYNELLSVGKKGLQYISVSLDDKYIAVTDKFKNLYLLEKDNNYAPIKLNSKKYKKDFDNITFSLDSKYLVSSNKHKFQIWKIEDGILFFSKRIKKSSYTTSSIQFDPNGKYLAISSLGNKKIELWNCQKLNISPNIEYKNESDKSPPQIVIINPRIVVDKVSVMNERIKLTGLAIDNYGLKSVSVNGVKCQLTSTGNFEIEMNLVMGNNHVTIIATDVNGNVETKKVNIVRKEFDIASLKFESKNHLLIISINDYKNWPKLNNAVSDANLFEKTLIQKYGFAKDNIIKIQDSIASKQNIINGFKKLIANVNPNDNVIIYFSGHGYFDPEIGEGYWIPSEATKGNDAAYLPNSFMMQLMKKINAKHMFLVADACFSGSLFNESHRGYTENVGSFKSRWGLASGRLEFVSDGKAGTQSPFNKYLIEYMEKNTSPTFSVSELVQYVKIKVANETNQTPVGNPLQNIGDEGGEFIFKLKK